MNPVEIVAREVEALLASGRAAEAIEPCRRMVVKAPRDPAAQFLMSRVFMAAGKPDQALHYAQSAAGLVPGEVSLLLHLARLLIICGRSERALDVLAKAARFDDVSPAVPAMRAGALLELNRCMEALAASRLASERSPGDASSLAQVASCLLNVGRPEEAMAILEPLATAPGAGPEYISGAALMTNYCPGWTRRRQHALHASYGRALAERLGPSPARAFAEPGVKRRVGIVSPDLRSHSVAWFIEPFLRHADRSRFEVICYQTNAVADDATKRLRALADDWRVMDNISDPGLAQAIFDDRIDIVVELSGHTHAHSLPCMHLRPAPRIFSYLGYPNVTGVGGLTGRIVDAVTDPPGCDGFGVEEACESLVRMNRCFLCYGPPAGCKEPGPAPMAAGTGVTFGSFNNVQKLSTATVRLWSRLLREVPGSRLLLKGVAFSEAALRADVLARFAAEGATSVEILPRAATTAAHLALYDRIDIGLDPTPYNGTTTTCEALWMGVPVITLAGETHASRVGASLLTAVGLSELIATDEEGYVRLAMALAGDASRVGAMRAGLRARVAGSELCDGAGWCREFERVLVGGT
jgi:Flp pilus assembly protein TadD